MAGFFGVFTGSYDLEAAYCHMTAVFTNKAPGGVAYACSFRITEAAYFIDVELPGVALDQISVTCHEGTLRIAGERRPSRELSPDSVQRVERYFGPFLREVSFPGPVDPKGVEAQLADGLLRLTVPKKRPGKRRIPVR